MEQLQEKLNYSFQDSSLLETALTHSSYANEHRCASNERLEFVGDSVLGMVTATCLYRTFPELPEGRLTRLRAELVCEQSLWEVADRLGLGACLRLGRGEALSGGRERHSILADCVEAVIAAMYLDGGIEPARRFIETQILSKLSRQDDATVRDWKTELQELVQQTPGRSVTYALLQESGPDHRKRFTAAALLDGKQIGVGEGPSKKEAEQLAAKCALAALDPAMRP
jgi:ribonuclease-3